MAALVLRIWLLVAAASTVTAEAGASVTAMIAEASNIESAKGNDMERLPSSLCKVVPNSAGPNKTMDTLECPKGAFPKGNSPVPTSCTEGPNGTLRCNSALMTGPPPNKISEEEYAKLVGSNAGPSAEEMAEELREQAVEDEDGRPDQTVRSCRNLDPEEDLQCVDLKSYIRKSSGLEPNEGEKQEALDGCTQWTANGGKWKHDFDKDCGDGSDIAPPNKFECPDGYSYQDDIPTNQMCAPEGEINHGGPGWGGKTLEESKASCAKECDKRGKECTDFTWYDDKGCRTFTKCEKTVDQPFGVKSYVCKKLAGVDDKGAAQEQWWKGWYLTDFTKCPCEDQKADMETDGEDRDDPTHDLERGLWGAAKKFFGWGGGDSKPEPPKVSKPKKLPSFLKALKPGALDKEPCPNTKCPCGSYKGKVHGRKAMKDGQCMRTSKILNDFSDKGYIETKSGSRYLLWKIDGWKRLPNGRVAGSLRGRPGMSGAMTTSPAKEMHCVETTDAKGYMTTASGSYYILGTSKEEIPGCEKPPEQPDSYLASLTSNLPKFSAPKLPTWI